MNETRLIPIRETGKVACRVAFLDDTFSLFDGATPEEALQKASDDLDQCWKVDHEQATGI